MMVTDPIADMLTRIRNAVQAHHETVDIPASKEKVEIANNPKRILFFKIDKPVKKDYFLRKVK